MSTSNFTLPNAPIIEAVLDVDCDMPPGFELTKLENPTRECFGDQYPKFKVQFLQEAKFETQPDTTPQMSIRRGIQAFQFLHADEKQVVQVRTQGFSFNRLAPYAGLDSYLPEIQRVWQLFVGLSSPAKIRSIQLRYINRILLPTENGRVSLDDYLKIGPRLPDEEKLIFIGFLNQHAVVETDTGNRANIVLTSQLKENEKFPIIFDICVTSDATGDPKDWSWILDKTLSLRALKNRIFRNTLTERCLSLFQ